MQFFYIIKIFLEKRRDKLLLRMHIIFKMEMDKDPRNRRSMMKFMIKKAKNKDTRSSGYSGVRGLSGSPQLLSNRQNFGKTGPAKAKYMYFYEKAIFCLSFNCLITVFS